MKKIILTLISAAVFFSLWGCEDRTDDESTVYHKQTGLAWTRCTIRKDGQADTTKDCSAIHMESTWEEAIQTCENLKFAGHDDWRLPNIKELQSIVSYDRLQPAIDQNMFPGTHLAHYWSSTTYGKTNNCNLYALCICFQYGNNVMVSKNSSIAGDLKFIRCVRGPSNSRNR